VDAHQHSDANAQCKWQNYGKTAPSCITLKDRHMRSNDPSSATAATRRADCNRDDPPPFAAAHG